MTADLLIRLTGKLPDDEIDDMEVARCACGLVFYSTEYALIHTCLGSWRLSTHTQVGYLTPSHGR